MKKLLAGILVPALLFLTLPLQSFAIGDGNMDGGGGGKLGEGTSKNVWSSTSAIDGTRREGVRVTVVRADTGARTAASVDYTNTTTVDNSVGFLLKDAIHFRQRSKLDYRNGTELSMAEGGYGYINPTTPLPSVISSAGNVTAIKQYFTDEQSVRMIASDVGIPFDTLINGQYKLLLEPVLYFIYNGYAYAATATEVALMDAETGGGIRKHFVSLSHNQLPFSMFLEAADLGISAYTGGVGSKVRASNEIIVSTLGVGIVRFADFDLSIAIDYEDASRESIARAKPGDDISIVLSCSNNGKQPAEDVPVTLEFGGRRLHTGMVSIEAGKVEEIRIPYTIPEGSPASILGIARINWENREEEAVPTNNEAQKALLIGAETGSGDYRINTDVITSVTLYAGEQITPKAPATVDFHINGTTYRMSNIVVPAGGSQLVWAKWHTPSTPQDLNITISTTQGALSEDEMTVQIVDLADNEPPDPKATDIKPAGFVIPTVPSLPATVSSNWSVWRAWWQENWEWEPDWVWEPDMQWVRLSSWDDERKEWVVYFEGWRDEGEWVDHGEYVDKGWWVYESDTYSAELSATGSVEPNGRVPTAQGKTMKSAYGVSIGTQAQVITSAPSSAYTSAQNALTYFPEFNYSTYFRAQELIRGGMNAAFQLKQNRYSTYGERVHFTPLWYPDGRYEPVSYVIDCWTPAGMLSAAVTDYVQIDGNVYADWHIGPKLVR